MEKATKIAISLFAAFVIFAILHNAMYGLFGTEEPVFFILALVSGFGFIVSTIYAIIIGIKHGKKKPNKITLMYVFAISSLVTGLLLNYFKIGRSDFSAFGSVGNWLIYIGFFGLIFSTIRLILKPQKRVVDERMVFLASKALKIAFLALVIIAFIVMIIDGIKPITMPYHLFMSYLVCGILVVYVGSYKVLLRFY